MVSIALIKHCFLMTKSKLGVYVAGGGYLT